MRTRVMLALIVAALIAWASFVALIEMTPRNESSTMTPPIAETIHLEPLSWEAERPLLDIEYDETINRCYLDVGSINETVEIPYYLDQSFWLRSNVTVALTTGYVHNISITAHNSAPSSQMVAALEKSIEVENLQVLPSSSSSYVGFSGLNLSSRATLRVTSRWSMTTPDSQTEQATLTVDVVYFNGTAYRKTTCPLYLKLTGCVNTNFDTAEEIKVGQTIMKRVLAWDSRPEEFYKIHLDKGEFVNVTMIPRGVPFDLYIYNSSDLVNPNFSSRNPYNLTENIIFDAYETSWYFIKVKADFGFGLYVLKVDYPIVEPY